MNNALHPHQFDNTSQYPEGVNIDGLHVWGMEWSYYDRQDLTKHKQKSKEECSHNE